jgi:hypothetical protein
MLQKNIDVTIPQIARIASSSHVVQASRPVSENAIKELMNTR